MKRNTVNMLNNIAYADVIQDGQSRRFLLYPLCLLAFCLFWYGVVLPLAPLYIFKDYWPSALTMTMGSFVAGSTPMGGGVVAFPVFTKYFGIETEQAKIFSLFIQSVGMTFATLFFISQRIPIYWRWLALLLPSSMLGLWVGFTYLQASSHHTKLLLSIIVLIAGISLLKTHFSVRDPDSAHRVPYWVFFVLGFPGGVLSSLVGTGADTLFFFVLVIIFHKNAKVIIPTSVAYMASCSLIGTSMIITSPAMQVTPFVLNSWMIAAPVVAIGAPLGGYAMSKANPGYLLIFIKVIIILEAVSTFVLVELGVFEKVVLGCAILGAAGYLLLKLKLLVRRPLVC